MCKKFPEMLSFPPWCRRYTKTGSLSICEASEHGISYSFLPPPFLSTPQWENLVPKYTTGGGLLLPVLYPPLLQSFPLRKAPSLHFRKLAPTGQPWAACGRRRRQTDSHALDVSYPTTLWQGEMRGGSSSREGCANSLSVRPRRSANRVFASSSHSFVVLVYTARERENIVR